MAAIKKENVGKPVVSVAPATDPTEGEETLEQLLAKINAIKDKQGKPLLERLALIEQEANDIRSKLRIMGIPAPQRILVDVSDDDVNYALLALYRVPNNEGMTLTSLEKFTAFPQSRMAGVRAQLDSDPASIAYKVIGGRQGKVVYLTKDGLKEAEEIVASDDGKALLAKIDGKIAEAKAAAAKKG